MSGAADVRRTVLPNGCTVLVRHDPSADAVAIVTWVKAGYFDEPDRVGGIAHVLEHMFFKGTPRFGPGEIATATKACGGFLNAATIYDHTAYYAVVPAGRFTEALDIQFDAWAHSTFDPDELRRELEVIVQEARRKRDTPGAVALETLYEVLHDRHRMRRWRIGHDDVLRSLTRDDLVAFHRAHYGPGNTIVAVVGAVDPDAAVAAVAARHGTRAPAVAPRDRGPAEDAPPGRRWRDLAGDLANAELVIGWRTVPPTHPDAPALDLAAGVLGTGRGARLWRAVRERGLAPSVSASHYTPTELGVFVLHADAPPATAEAAVRTMWHEARRLASEGPARHELERVRRLHAVRRRRRRESMDGQAMELAAWEALGDPTFGDAWQARLESCTPDEVRDALARWCDPGQASVVVHRPHGMPAIGGEAGGFAVLEAPVEPSAVAPPPSVPLVTIGRAPDLAERRDGVCVFRTRHGVPVLVQRVAGMPIAHVGASLLGGAVQDDPARAGRALLAARAMARATTSLDPAAMAATSEWLGGGIAASGGADTLGWYVSVPPDALAPAAKLLADVVLRPRLAAGTIATERRLMTVDAVQLRDDMARWPMRLAIDAAWRGHPYGVPAAGTPDTLPTIADDDVRAWHAAHVASAHGVLVYVGDVEPAEAAATLATVFDDWRLAPPPPVSPAAWPDAVRQVVERRERRQTALTLLFAGPARGDTDREAAQLVAAVAGGLGGRVFEALRSRASLAYTVQVFTGDRRAGGYVGGYLATDPAREDEARDGLLREFARLVEEPVTPEELARARSYLLGTHAIRRQSGAAVLGDLLDAWLLADGLAALAAWPRRIAAVTPDDCTGLVAAYVDASRRVEGVVRGAAAP